MGVFDDNWIPMRKPIVNRSYFCFGSKSPRSVSTNPDIFETAYIYIFVILIGP